MKSPKPSIEKRIVESLESFARALEQGEEARFTCRKVTLNLGPAREFGPSDVKDVRRILGASQSLFAQFLGVSASAVRAWERGEKKPMPLACRFMDEIRRTPKHWRERFADLVSPRTARQA